MKVGDLVEVLEQHKEVYLQATGKRFTRPGIVVGVFDSPITGKPMYDVFWDSTHTEHFYASELAVLTRVTKNKKSTELLNNL